jgi:release factor glutamine methyltransferase
LNNLKIKTINGDFYKSILKHKVDFIVCNPPYVSVKTLDKKMTKYETRISFNNGNPLFFYSKIISNYKKIFNDTDHFLIGFEIGFNLKPSIIKLLKENNLLRNSKFHKDYAGHNRLLIINASK